MKSDSPKMTAEELEKFLYAHFPDTAKDRLIRVEEAGSMHARIRLLYDDKHLRPGGTISGPSL
ncbi:MAG: hypothetical protein ACREAC_17765, partial [Blastocatellia bacterium]